MLWVRFGENSLEKLQQDLTTGNVVQLQHILFSAYPLTSTQQGLCSLL